MFVERGLVRVPGGHGCFPANGKIPVTIHIAMKIIYVIIWINTPLKIGGTIFSKNKTLLLIGLMEGEREQKLIGIPLN